jgi:4-amino-4-deoxychorismate lyase
MAALKTLVDGCATAQLPADDRGLLYGDGLFETCVLRRGRIELWTRHLQRLREGCQRLGMPMPDVDALADESRQLYDGVSDGLVKLIVTRGSGGRGYYPPSPAVLRRIWQLFPLPDYPRAYAQQGVCLHRCQTRLAHNPLLAGIKHLNRLEQVLARSEWDDAALPEGLLQDSAGNIIEATMSNLFMVSDGRLLTPDLSRCGVAGVMRAELLALASEAGIEARVGAISRQQLDNADELFLTNSVIRLWPVRAVGQQRYQLGALGRRLALLLDGRLSR